MRPVRFQSTAPTTNAYPSGSDWAPRSHRGPVERLSQRERRAFRPGSGHLLGEFSFNSPSCASETFLDSRHGDATLGRKFSNGRLVNMVPVQQLSLGFGNRVQGAALRPHIVVFASIGAAERQGLGSRGMAMPAGKDAVGGVASGVDLGGQPLEHAGVNSAGRTTGEQDQQRLGYSAVSHAQCNVIAGAKRGYQAAARPGHCDRDRSLVGQLSQLRAQQRSFATRRAMWECW